MLKKAIELFEKERYKEALEIFKQLKDDKEALYYIGMCYYEGYGVKKDEKEAIRWWKKGDRKGSLDAKYMLQTICATSSVFSRE